MSQATETANPLGRIVAATDFSPTAGRATAWAAWLARVHGAHLTLAHALRLPGAFPSYVPPSPELDGALQDAARETLETAAEPLRAAGQEVHTRLVEGTPAEALLELCRQLPADLLVVGTRGHSALAQLFLGSTAQRLVQGADCAVLTTHGEAEAAPERISTILVPTDFSDNALAALEAARCLLGPMGERQRLILLHAYALPIEYTAYGNAPTSPVFLEESRLRAEADLKELAANLEGEGLEVETQAMAGYPAETILAAAEASSVDLIAMGTAGRSGLSRFLLGSTAERVVQRARCPVLTVRHKEAGGD